HQDLPFERLVEELNPERDLSRTPVFQVMLALQNAPREGQEPGSLRRRGVGVDAGTAKFDLAFFFGDDPHGLPATIEYASDLFDGPPIDRMTGHLQNLLEGITAAPETPIAALPLLSGPERRRLLVEWNATAAPYPNEASLHRLIEEQVKRGPDRVAAAF